MNWKKCLVVSDEREYAAIFLKCMIIFFSGSNELFLAFFILYLNSKWFCWLAKIGIQMLRNVETNNKKNCLWPNFLNDKVQLLVRLKFCREKMYPWTLRNLLNEILRFSGNKDIFAQDLTLTKETRANLLLIYNFWEQNQIL